MKTIIHKVFSKECKCIEKKVIIHIIDDLESSSDEYDDSDVSEEKLIKYNIFRENNFQKFIFSGSNFENVF